MPGRPAPIALRMLKTPSVKAKRIERRGISAASDKLDPPGWLTADQKADWAFLVEQAPPGMLANVDRGVLTIFVIAADQHRRASIQAQTLRPGHPINATVLKQAAMMIKAASELGLSAAARARVQLPPPAPESGGWEGIE